MAKYGSDDLEITFGGTSLRNYIDTINGLDIEALMQESHAFGDSWVEQLFSGVKRASDLVLGGFFDDTITTGPDVVFNTLGSTIAVVITWGGSKTSSFNALVKMYKRSPVRNESTRFEVTLAPSGAISEA